MKEDRGELIYNYNFYKDSWSKYKKIPIFLIGSTFPTLFVIVYLNNFNMSFLFIIIISTIIILVSLLFLIGGWIESFVIKVPFELYENGIVSPIRTFKQYRKKEVTWIPFKDIYKIQKQKYYEYPGIDTIEIMVHNNPAEYSFISAMIGGEEGLALLEEMLKRKVPEKWASRKILRY
jgi:hypothetical protein